MEECAAYGTCNTQQTRGRGDIAVGECPAYGVVKGSSGTMKMMLMKTLKQPHPLFRLKEVLYLGTCMYVLQQKRMYFYADYMFFFIYSFPLIKVNTCQVASLLLSHSHSAFCGNQTVVGNEVMYFCYDSSYTSKKKHYIVEQIIHC